MSPPHHFLAVDIAALLRRGSMPDLRTPAKQKIEYLCKRCRTCITEKTSVISWNFRGTAGKAALVKQAKNVSFAPPSVLLMNSGAYRVQNSFCSNCKTPVGWKFVDASDRAEKWKEGYFIVELSKLEEENSPLSPLDPPIVTETQRYRLPIPDIVIGHRRVLSHVLPSERTHPLGPREMRNSFFEDHRVAKKGVRWKDYALM